MKKKTTKKNIINKRINRRSKKKIRLKHRGGDNKKKQIQTRSPQGNNSKINEVENSTESNSNVLTPSNINHSGYQRYETIYDKNEPPISYFFNMNNNSDILIVYCHGMGADGPMFGKYSSQSNLISKFLDDYCCLIPDFPGTNYSQPPQNLNYCKMDYICNIIHLLITNIENEKNITFKEIYFIGYSMGSGPAALCTQSYANKNRLGGLVFLEGNVQEEDAFASRKVASNKMNFMKFGASIACNILSGSCGFRCPYYIYKEYSKSLWDYTKWNGNEPGELAKIFFGLIQGNYPVLFMYGGGGGDGTMTKPPYKLNENGFYKNISWVLNRKDGIGHTLHGSSIKSADYIFSKINRLITEKQTPQIPEFNIDFNTLNLRQEHEEAHDGIIRLGEDYRIIFTPPEDWTNKHWIGIFHSDEDYYYNYLDYRYVQPHMSINHNEDYYELVY